MNILFVSSSMQDGGAQRVVSVLANAYVAQGHCVEILSIEGGLSEYELDRRIEYIPFPGERASGRFRRLKERKDFIERSIRAYDPDVVVSFCTEPNIYAIVAARNCEKPVVVSERNDPVRDPRSKATRFLRRLMYRYADGFVFQTEQAAQFFSPDIQSRAVVLANPVKQGLPSPFAGRRRRSVVTAARLEPQKNIDLLLKAFARFEGSHPGYHLEIFGRGGEEQRLKALAMSLGLAGSVEFRGFSVDLPSEICEASCFVLSSDYEGMPNALIEAMALGLPVISTDCPCGGPAALINNEINGLLVPVGDVEQMADAMGRIADSEEFANRVGSNAAKIRIELSSDSISQRWIEYINCVLKRKKG